MNIDFDKDLSKEEVFRDMAKYIQSIDFHVVSHDSSRPWGGFFVIDESESARFISHFFPEIDLTHINAGNRLSPKFLIVAPNSRLSWQYHHRRSEIWKVIGGEAAIATSDTDEQNDPRPLKKHSVINLKQGERHRLIGARTWGVVAEIWQHTDPENPSDESDIVRVQDDFGR